MTPFSLTPGQYVNVHGGGFAGWLIRTFTHAPVAHTYVYVGPQPNGYDIVEATPGGVRFGYSTSYDWATSFPSKIIPTEEQSKAMCAAAVGSVGESYGWVADFFIGMREGLKIPVSPWVFKLKSVTSHRECAQLADWVGIQGGLNYFNDGREPGSVSPAALWRLGYSWVDVVDGKRAD